MSEHKPTNVTCITSETELQRFSNVINDLLTSSPPTPYRFIDHNICISTDAWLSSGISIMMIQLRLRGKYEHCDVSLQEIATENVYSWSSHYITDVTHYLDAVHTTASEKQSLRDLDDHVQLPHNIPSVKIFNSTLKRYRNSDIKLYEIPEIFNVECNAIYDKFEKIGRKLRDASIENIEFYTENFKDWDSHKKIIRIINLKNTSNYALFYIYWMIAEARATDKKINDICLDIEERIKSKNYITSTKKAHVTDLFFSFLPKDQALSKILTNDIKDVTPEFMHSCGH